MRVCETSRWAMPGTRSRWAAACLRCAYITLPPVFPPRGLDGGCALRRRQGQPGARHRTRRTVGERLEADMTETFTKWEVTEQLQTREDARLYLEACAKEDPGDGSLIRAAPERYRAGGKHEPAGAGDRNEPGGSLQGLVAGRQSDLRDGDADYPGFGNAVADYGVASLSPRGHGHEDRPSLANVEDGASVRKLFEGRELMNKSEIASRLAGRMGLSKSAAADAVDAVFATISQAVANLRAVAKRARS